MLTFFRVVFYFKKDFSYFKADDFVRATLHQPTRQLN